MFNKELKAANEKLAALEKENVALKEENAALKLVNEVSDDAVSVKRLSDEERQFEIEWKDPDGKAKKGTFLLADVSKIYVSGKKYTQEAFMKDKDVQLVAVLASHPHIKKV